jgi:Zn-dependent protease
MRGGISLGRPGGVPVRLHVSFLFLGVLVALSVAAPLRAELPRLSSAVVEVLSVVLGALLLVCVALHELAHALVARRLRIEVSGIDLWGLGGVTGLASEPTTARAQYLVSVSGPVVNLLIGAPAALVWIGTDVATIPHALALRLALANALLAAYNLLPGLPLDGGQILRAGVWGLTGDKVTGLRAAGYGGLVAAVATAALALDDARRGGQFWLFTLLIAGFIGVQATGALRGAVVARRLPFVVAGRLARPAFLAVTDLPLAEALRRATAAGCAAVVLGAEDAPTGVMSDALLAQVPAQRRPWVALSSVVQVIRPGAVLDARLSGEALLEVLRRAPAPEYVVMDAGRLVGVLRTADVATVLRAARPGAVATA